MVLLVLAVSTGLILFLLAVCGWIHPWLRLLFEGVLCGRLLALRSLGEAGYSVRDPLLRGDIEGARKAVSMIVGRDTERLDEEGIAKAAVETVAENTSDGVTAPLFYMILFGGIGGIFYKAVNTMDSMTGYKNARYMYFGTAAARLDDIMNFIPARLSALALIASAFILKYDGKNAWKIFRRDRYKHASPNSAQTESVCAGALDLRLAGDAVYFGKKVSKPYIGDAIKEVEPDDIRRANRMLYVASALSVVVFTAVRLLICRAVGLI
jgi:adenosylcobinamide-phosphate synthase